HGSLELATGDVIALPNGDAFALRDGPDSPVVPIAESGACSSTPMSVPGAQTELIVLHCALSGGCSNPIRKQLPQLIHSPRSDGRVARWLDRVVGLLAVESATPATGRSTVLDRLAEVLFIHLVRAWLDGQPAECGGWLRAMSDSQLGRALSAFHAEPGKTWTV